MNSNNLLCIFITVLSMMISTIGAIEVFETCINKKDFALTFDDGPDTRYTYIILDTLKEEGVKATFFVNADNSSDLKNDPTARDIIKREYDEGHVVASHTYSHPMDITELEEEELDKEIKNLNDLLYEIIGVKPAFFRPPSGSYNEKSLEILERNNMTASILWNLDSEDWNSHYNATEQYYDALEGKDPEENAFIALNHDIQKVTAMTNLKIVIPYIKHLGYNFVTMDECLGMPAYQGQEKEKKEEEEKLVSEGIIINNDRDADDFNTPFRLNNGSSHSMSCHLSWIITMVFIAFSILLH